MWTSPSASIVDRQYPRLRTTISLKQIVGDGAIFGLKEDITGLIMVTRIQLLHGLRDATTRGVEELYLYEIGGRSIVAPELCNFGNASPSA